MKTETQGKHIAIFGSAFNPPTFGHLSVIKRLSHFDKILLVPCYQHAWGKKLVAFDKRCEWLSMFIHETALNNVELCKAEKDIFVNRGVTTWDLLLHLSSFYPHADLTFVMGPDNFKHFEKFHKSNEILARWNVLTCPETVNIRSTHIRENLQKGHDISAFTSPQLASLLNAEDFMEN